MLAPQKNFFKFLEFVVYGEKVLMGMLPRDLIRLEHFLVCLVAGQRIEYQPDKLQAKCCLKASLIIRSFHF